MSRLLSSLVIASCVSCFVAPSASAATITFDLFADGDSLTNQIAGLTFTNAEVLSAGVGLNEFEFPPHSGSNVVFDSGGAISIAFDSPLAVFVGFFTYLQPITLAAYDASHVLLGSVSSAFLSNLALSGDAGSAPNELLQLAFAAGISSVLITGDPLGGSFTLDDATLTPVDSAQVPEPGTISLVLLGGAAVLRRGFKAAHRRSALF